MENEILVLVCKENSTDPSCFCLGCKKEFTDETFTAPCPFCAGTEITRNEKFTDKKGDILEARIGTRPWSDQEKLRLLKVSRQEVEVLQQRFSLITPSEVCQELVKSEGINHRIYFTLVEPSGNPNVFNPLSSLEIKVK